MEIIRECPTWVEYVDDWGYYRIDWADMTWGTKGGNKMLDYRPAKLQKHDDNITLAWRSDTGVALDFKMRLSGWSTSYIIAYVRQTPKYILMGRQEDIADAYNDIQNGGELEFLASAQHITPTQINAYATL